MSAQARQQLGSAGGSQLLAPVPSGSYISYAPSRELGSELQKVQRLRAKVSLKAWQGMPTPNMVRSLPRRMSSRRIRRLDSVLKRFGNASFSAPAEVRPWLEGACQASLRQALSRAAEGRACQHLTECTACHGA